MQLGSGSLEFMPGLTFFTTRGSWSFGGQTRVAIRLNENNRGYRPGPATSSTFWVAHRFNHWLSVSARGLFENRGNIAGREAAFEPANGATESLQEHAHESATHNEHAAPLDTAELVTAPSYLAPTMDANLQGGARGSLLVGLNFILADKLI